VFALGFAVAAASSGVQHLFAVEGGEHVGGRS
jgi:hypothetical protein